MDQRTWRSPSISRAVAYQWILQAVLATWAISTGFWLVVFNTASTTGAIVTISAVLCFLAFLAWFGAKMRPRRSAEH